MLQLIFIFDVIKRCSSIIFELSFNLLLYNNMLNLLSFTCGIYRQGFNFVIVSGTIDFSCFFYINLSPLSMERTEREPLTIFKRNCHNIRMCLVSSPCKNLISYFICDKIVKQLLSWLISASFALEKSVYGFIKKRIIINAT